VIKKAVVYTIFISMALHCTCRLGFLNQVYQKRHQIAYTVGLIAEIPIALCNSDYDFGKDFKIEVRDDQPSPSPNLFKISEINLFYSSTSFVLETDFWQISNPHAMYADDKKHAPPEFPIFHPPSVI